MQEFAIDDFVLMTGGDPALGFNLSTPIEGLESPSQRTASYSNPGQHGVTVSGQFYNDRIVKLVGGVYGDDYAEYEANRRALVQAVAIKTNAEGYPVPRRVAFTTRAGDSYYADVYFDKPVMAMTSPIDAEFQIMGVCADPFIFGTETVVSAQIKPPTGGGYVVPMVVPYISAATVGGSISITNDGSEVAMPVITLVGPLSTPSLTNQTNSKTIELDYTIPSGVTVTIDMSRQTIIRGGASLIGAKTIESDWWGLEPDSNTLSLSTLSSSDTGYATVTFNPPYVGV